MPKVLVGGKLGKGFSALDAMANEGGYSRSFAPLSQWVALLLLAESRKRPILISHSFEFAKQSGTEKQTQSKTGVPYQCL